MIVQYDFDIFLFWCHETCYISSHGNDTTYRAVAKTLMTVDRRDTGIAAPAFLDVHSIRRPLPNEHLSESDVNSHSRLGKGAFAKHSIMHECIRLRGLC